ncbi:hypothetical protein [Paenibacillus silagei]|uniref:Uncharacterized protein n=1 Tax=Paenibacillus silagei TaxID=1670801 RepID=A0ABS4NQH7_9BACL|nr:hypothetical protein [Paenibacillus silagei]MBP2111669.1 hypothetical protein [Paenibacillus silagei]
MIYFLNRVNGMEGLCNQFMALFRTISEAFLYRDQGESACIILADGQTRNFINLSDEPFFSPLSIDAFIEVDQFQKVLAIQNVSLLRLREAGEVSQGAIVVCSRFPISPMTPDSSLRTGAWIANSIPFAQKPLQLADAILGWMSQHSNWTALQMRIEGDVLYQPGDNSISYDDYVQQQARLATDFIAQLPPVSAVYVATGVEEELLREAMSGLREAYPEVVLLTKKDFLRDFPASGSEFNSLSLEEQALVDWLVCLGAPNFLGPHGTSFSYLAGYMRHYRGLAPNTTLLWPENQQYWELWFPRL